jgi:Zinc carboxypeptidase/Chitobiase/beta-hexosaminidase C-terminal domain
MQRRNLTNHCVVGGKETDNPNAQNFWRPRINPSTGLLYTATDPGARNTWGVDLNRNNTAGTIFDGYIGASHSCTSDVFAGPAEASEPEIKNELWVADRFDNIKFSNNIHSFGGYFMWSPGAYLTNRDEGDLVHPNIGVEKYFFEAGDRILNRIKEHRNTVILPERTGPIADVLYSAAGNSADEHWYNRDVIAYSFETGADRFVPTTLSVAAAAGSTGIRVPNRNSFRVGDRVVFEPGTANQEVRFVDSVVNPNPDSPAPNVFLTEALTFAHAAGSTVTSEAIQSGVGFQPDYATEGKHEAMEFASGNYGLLESAFDYAQDVQPPQVQMTGPFQSSTEIETTFEFINEPSVIRYTTDGSRPTNRSRLWDSTGPREPGEVFHLTRTTTFRWLAEDIKGNVSRGSQQFVITPTG